MFDFSTVTQWFDALLRQTCGLSDFWAILIECVLVGLIVLTLYALIAMFMIYFERKVCAFFQCRLGPMRVGKWGIFQVLADVLKMLIKEIFGVDRSDKFLYALAPFLTIIASVGTFSFLPWNKGAVVLDFNVGVFMVTAISSIGVLGVILSGWGSNNKYSVVSAMRGAVQMISYEISLGLCMITAVVLCGSMQLSDIIAAQTSALELKLAAIETAMKEESIALEDKLALVEQAIKDQTTNFDAKMELLTTAITSMPDYSAKLAAIETAISNVPDYATQLAAIKAVMNGINTTLTDKLALLEGINDAITDNAAKLDAIKAVIDALPDYSTEFANIKTEIANLLQAVKDGTTSTETALAAIAAKIEEMKAAGGVSGGGTTGGGTGTEKIVPKDFVDLGLPSGLLWAKYNIGAATENETGGYFSWGETAPKTKFGYGKYKFWNGSTFTKYNWSDNLMELQPEDDAATVILGPWCHTPTKAEWEELIEKCTWEATKVTMPGTTEPVVAYWKVTGPNGNHIILPSTGYYWDDGLHFSWSFYNSSTLKEVDTVCSLGWDHSGVTEELGVSYDHPTIARGSRKAGYVIRAVCSTK